MSKNEIQFRLVGKLFWCHLNFTEVRSFEFAPICEAMPTTKEDRDRAIQVQEKQYLETLIRISGGDIKQCCETADLSCSRLYDL